MACYEPVLASIDVVRILAVSGLPGRPAMTGSGWAGVEHRSALAAGATERHAPAVWTDYHDDYCGGFVDDPHGINLEAVCHHRP